MGSPDISPRPWGGHDRSRARLKSLAAVCVAGAGVDGCGVSIRDISAHDVMVHATDPVAVAIEDLQLTLGEGPCVDVQKSGGEVLISDLRRPGGPAERWPMFLSEVTGLGVAAVFAFPVRVGDVSLGVVDLYRSTVGPMSKAQLSSTLETVSNIGHSLVETHNEATPSSEGESTSMIAHRAAGMVMVQLEISIEEALVRLRASAFAEGRPVADLAGDVVDGRIRFRRGQR